VHETSGTGSVIISCAVEHVNISTTNVKHDQSLREHIATGRLHDGKLALKKSIPLRLTSKGLLQSNFAKQSLVHCSAEIAQLIKCKDGNKPGKQYKQEVYDCLCSVTSSVKTICIAEQHKVENDFAGTASDFGQLIRFGYTVFFSSFGSVTLFLHQIKASAITSASFSKRHQVHICFFAHKHPTTDAAVSRRATLSRRVGHASMKFWLKQWFLTFSLSCHPLIIVLCYKPL